MSLLTDVIFVKALRSNSDLIAELPAGDVYNVAIALPDEDADNAPLPNIIVSFDGLQNDISSKDDQFEGDEDRVQISIEVAATTRPQLGDLVVAIRQTISEYFHENYGSTDDDDFSLIPNSMTFSAAGVKYDPDKPCYWQVLQYQCDTDLDE